MNKSHNPSAMKDQTNQEPSMAHNNVAIAGNATFVIKAAQEFLMATQKCPDLAKFDTRITQSRFFRNAPNFEFDDSDGKQLQYFQLEEPTSEKYIGAWKFKIMQVAFFDQNMPAIRTIHAVLEELAKKELRELAKEIQETKLGEIHTLCRAFVESATTVKLLKEGNLSKEFVEENKKEIA